MKILKKILIYKSKSIKDAISILNKNSTKILAVINKKRELIGTITDGDIRRSLLRSIDINLEVSHIMHKRPIYALQETTDKQIMKLMKKHDIHHVPIVNKFKHVVDLKTLQNLAFPKRKDNIIFIMAGGFGKRLMPLTNKIPKPMIKINNKPMLEVIFNEFVNSNFKNFYISTHYKADKIKKYFGDGSSWNVNINYINEQIPLGTAGSLSFIKNSTNKLPIVVINADVIVKFDIDSLIKFHEKNKNDITITVRSSEIQIPFGVVELARSKVKNIREKPTINHMVNTGIYIIEQKILKEMKKNKRIDMTDFIMQNIERKRKVGAYLLHEDWIDIGRMEDLLKFKNNE